MKRKNAKGAQLVVERGGDAYWGRVKINNNLIADSANSIDSLKKKIKDLVFKFENVEVEHFDVSYDLTSFFEQYSYLNISDIAKRTGINPGLMRQYATGNKFPSAERVKEIETGIRQIGRELARVKLHQRQKEPA